MTRYAKALIVDDDPVALEITREWLERAGFVVYTRSKVLGTAISLLRDPPDVALIDVGLPYITGDLLAEIITGQPLLSKVVVVLYSSRPAEALAALARQCGAAGFIEKTSDEQRFIQQLHILLSSRSASS